MRVVVVVVVGNRKIEMDYFLLLNFPHSFAAIFTMLSL